MSSVRSKTIAAAAAALLGLAAGQAHAQASSLDIGKNGRGNLQRVVIPRYDPPTDADPVGATVGPVQGAPHGKYGTCLESGSHLHWRNESASALMVSVASAGVRYENAYLYVRPPEKTATWRLAAKAHYDSQGSSIVPPGWLYCAGGSKPGQDYVQATALASGVNVASFSTLGIDSVVSKTMTSNKCFTSATTWVPIDLVTYQRFPTQYEPRTTEYCSVNAWVPPPPTGGGGCDSSGGCGG